MQVITPQLQRSSAKICKRDPSQEPHDSLLFLIAQLSYPHIFCYIPESEPETLPCPAALLNSMKCLVSGLTAQLCSSGKDVSIQARERAAREDL